jgi:cytidine deaminase
VRFHDLIQAATRLARPFAPSDDVTSGTVAAALLTRSGALYTGVCIDTACSLGFCAEHAAVAEMLKALEAEVQMILAVNSAGEVLPPCGRCRELLWQLSAANAHTQVMLGPNESHTLRELLPHRSLSDESTSDAE